MPNKLAGGGVYIELSPTVVPSIQTSACESTLLQEYIQEFRICFDRNATPLQSAQANMISVLHNPDTVDTYLTEKIAA